MGIALPVVIMNVAYLPFLICRRVGLNMRRYLLSVTTGPTISVLPFAVCLLAARLIFERKPLMGMAVGSTVGGAVLAVLYWRWVLPEGAKMWVSCLLTIRKSLARN
jgi:hypothetical protein